MIPLPETDESVEALPRGTREAIARAWERRARDELASSRFFQLLAEALSRRECAEAVLSLVRDAVSEERGHQEVCRAVARRYRGGEGAELTPLEVLLPAFRGASSEVSATLHVVASSCLSETVAVEFLRTVRAEAQGGVVREAARRLLADEIRHARFGWAHLASREVTDAERREVARAFPGVLRFVRQEWSRAGASEAPLPGHGFLDVPGVLRVFDDVVRDVVIPGLRHVGVPVEA